MLLLDSGICREAAVNGKNYTRDSRRRAVVAEEEGSAEKLGCVNVSAHGRAVEDLCASCGGSAVLVKEKLVVLCGNEESGSDSVATNSRACKVSCKPLCEVGDTCLCRRVCGDLCERGVCVHRGDVEDTAALLCYEILCKYLGGKKSSLEVELKYEVNAVSLKIEEGLAALLCLVLILVPFISTSICNS